MKEQYEYVPGFSKQVAKTAARLDLSGLLEGYGFQFEVRLADIMENDFKLILDTVYLNFKM